ncbi:hypothetical protein GM661_13320 [Iocasia frigidifontis]|uniref:Uncharacterized protein n=1 Tax=Iocasia fonsfrigidae TaxID=2682810 RepID=A0A8A7KAM6_9FIRM|nr:MULTISPECIES: hypothetical protein [Halanaerobiaceae]AZO95985.1 hypothetical protein D7D81_16075 [Halocella sp. SP3-1]QTL98873.1 hypothetical protein GM661_13320 [Iocasia fonsfrigidae]
MDKETLSAIQEMLEQQSAGLSKELDMRFDSFRDEVKQELKPIKGQLYNMEKDIKVLKRDIKDIRFDIKALKNASLELSEEHLNHVHQLGDEETSRPIRDIN